MKNAKGCLYTAVIGLMLFAQLARPIMVYADEGSATPPPADTPIETLPPTEPPTEIPVETPTLEPVTTEVPVETAIASDVPPAPEATATPVVDAAPLADSSPETDAATMLDNAAPTVMPEDAVAVEAPTLLEEIQELPGDTSIVVLDASGEAEPLATQDAAQIIASSDPVWCPGNQAPTPSANGCTNSYATLAELVDAIQSGTDPNNIIIDNGTIWITSGPVADTGPVWIDGQLYPTWSTFALTLQGGWSGASGDASIGANSVFSVPISIWNWNSSVTVNNITIQDTVDMNYAGLEIQTNSGDVTVNDSLFTRNYVGVYVTMDGDTVSINRSTFHDNEWDGLQIFTDSGIANNISLTGNTFSYNNRNYSDGYGAWVVTDPGDNATVDGNTFINNWWGLVTPYARVNADILTANIFDLNCYDLYVDFTVYELGNNYCGAPLEPTVLNTTTTLATFVQVQGSEKFSLNCADSGGEYSRSLPNGDLVQIVCPVSGDGKIARLDSASLPAVLPAGYRYASAFEVQITQNGMPIDVIEEGGYIRSYFATPPLLQGNRYSILYWDQVNGNWVALKDFIRGASAGAQEFYLFPSIPDDTRKILSGVRLTDSNRRVNVITNFPGIYVLVQQ